MYGQNFLIDFNLLKLLAGAGELDDDDVVLEIGVGTGSLTQLVAPRVAHVVAVEIDPQLFQLASEELGYLRNVTLLQADALKNKNQLNPDVLEAVQKELRRDEDRRFKLVANLPYNVATPVISNLLALDRPPDLMAVTIQKELGERMTATPSTKDYSALSAWVQCQCQVRIVRVMPPEVFWPRPKVSSAIVRLALDPERRQSVPDLEYFHDFVRRLFMHRRKFLRSILIGMYKGELEKAQVDEVLAEMNLGPTARAEELPWPEMVRLGEAMRQKVAG